MYRNNSIIDESLPIWFGKSNDTVTNEPALVRAFRTENGYDNVPGSFYLFKTETPKGTVGIISVRGTSTKYEMLIDCQLWLTAFLVQILRALLPFGFIFNPIFPYLIEVINNLQSNNRVNAHLYQVMTA